MNYLFKYKQTFIIALFITIACFILYYKMLITSWSSDCFIFENIAINLQSGDLTNIDGNHSIPPVFPLLTALLSNILGISPAITGIWISMLSYLGCLIIIYLMAKKIFDQTYSLFIILMMLIHPIILKYAVLPLRTSFYLFLCLLLIYLLIEYITENKKQYLIPMPFIAIVISLTRPEGIEIVFLTIAFILLYKFSWIKLLKTCFTCSLILTVFTGITTAYASLSDSNWSFINYISDRKIDISSMPYAIFTVLNELQKGLFIPVIILVLIGGYYAYVNRSEMPPMIKIISFFIIAEIVLRTLSTTIGIPCLKRHLILPITLLIFFTPFALMQIKICLDKKIKFLSMVNYLVVIIFIIVLTIVPKTFKDRSKRSDQAPLGIINKSIDTTSYRKSKTKNYINNLTICSQNRALYSGFPYSRGPIITPLY